MSGDGLARLWEKPIRLVGWGVWAGGEQPSIVELRGVKARGGPKYLIRASDGWLFEKALSQHAVENLVRDGQLRLGRDELDAMGAFLLVEATYKVGSVPRGPRFGLFVADSGWVDLRVRDGADAGAYLKFLNDWNRSPPLPDLSDLLALLIRTERTDEVPFMTRHVPEGGLNLRAEPDRRLDPILRVAAGAGVFVLRALGSWAQACLVESPSVSGWLDRRRLFEEP